MPITNESDQIAPNLIEVGDRQRSVTKLTGLIDSIKLYGILVPLIVRREIEPDTYGGGIPRIILVAGRRRLACAIELGLETVPVRYYDTLDPVEAKIIELEENIKRENLLWRDQVRAIGEFDKLKRDADLEWNATRTAEALSYSARQIQDILIVFGSLESPAITTADNLAHAIGILQRISERRTASYVDELLRAPSTSAFPVPNTAPTLATLDDLDIELQAINKHETISTEVTNVPPRFIPEPTNPIIVADFIPWVASYSGPKFNLIHCDFPYGVHAADATIEHYENTKELFWNLTETLTSNIDKLLSYSAHVIFWLSFENYETVKTKLSSTGLHVINRPLIWVRSDSRGAAPGIRGTQPKHSYEICLLCYRGNRPLVKQGTDSYSAQTVTNPIHPTQKPESMLKHFLSMLVDNVTDFLDPTCGSGSALRAADDLGARLVLGLEKDPGYAAAANAATLRARQLRKANAIISAEQPMLPLEL